MGLYRILTAEKSKVGGVCKFFLAQSHWTYTNLQRKVSCHQVVGQKCLWSSGSLLWRGEGEWPTIDPACEWEGRKVYQGVGNLPTIAYNCSRAVLWPSQG